MAYQYKVTTECYYDGVYRTPDKHSIVAVEKKFAKKDQPSYLEIIGGSDEQESASEGESEQGDI